MTVSSTANPAGTSVTDPSRPYRSTPGPFGGGPVAWFLKQL